MMPTSQIDLPTFEALKEAMGADFLPELVHTYFDETPTLFDSLQAALKAGDFEAFRRAAHSIKSTSNSFGALEFGLLAKELEYMGRDANLEGAETRVQTLLKNYDSVVHELKELLND